MCSPKTLTLTQNMLQRFNQIIRWTLFKLQIFRKLKMNLKNLLTGSILAATLFFSIHATAGPRCTEAFNQLRSAEEAIKGLMPGDSGYNQALRDLVRAEAYVELACVASTIGIGE